MVVQMLRYTNVAQKGALRLVVFWSFVTCKMSEDSQARNPGRAAEETLKL